MTYVYLASKEGDVQDYFTLKPGETVDDRVPIFGRFDKGSNRFTREIRDLKRMFSDRRFRDRNITTYNDQVWPRSKKIGFREWFSIARRRQPGW